MCSHCSSCPALCRASTTMGPKDKKDVNGRQKPGHDGDLSALRAASQGPTVNLLPLIHSAIGSRTGAGALVPGSLVFLKEDGGSGWNCRRVPSQNPDCQDSRPCAFAPKSCSALPSCSASRLPAWASPISDLSAAPPASRLTGTASRRLISPAISTGS